jgi:aldose 1-epimerase
MDRTDPQRLELIAGDITVAVDAAAGGRLASFVVNDAERLVVSPPPDQDNPELRWGCFVMAPWAGRIAAARFTWHGRDVALPANYDGTHAIHGLGTDRAWEVVEQTGDTVELRCDVAEAPWPFTGASLSSRITLDPGTLAQQIRVRAGRHAMPASAGWHPWFARPAAGDLHVTVDAATHLELDAEGIPTGRRQSVAGETDLRHGPALAKRRLDHVYVRPGSTAVVAWPDLRLELSLGSTVVAAVVHTPPEGVCVEPQSAWPDAVNLPDRANTGLVTLQPGDELVVDVTWRWSAPAR